MPEDSTNEFPARLRRATDLTETVLGEVEALIGQLTALPEREEQNVVMRSVLQCALGDLESAQGYLYRASLSQQGIIRKLLQAVFSRPLTDEPSELPSGGDTALDPFRPQLLQSAIEVEGLLMSLSRLRASIEEYEVTKEVDLPESPEPVINFAGGMVAGVIEMLDDASDLLYRATALTDEILIDFWAERMIGTPPDENESNS